MGLLGALLYCLWRAALSQGVGKGESTDTDHPGLAGMSTSGFTTHLYIFRIFYLLFARGSTVTRWPSVGVWWTLTTPSQKLPGNPLRWNLGWNYLEGGHIGTSLNPFNIRHFTSKMSKQYGSLGNPGPSCVSDLGSQQAAVNGVVNEAADSHSGADPIPQLAACSRESHVFICPQLFKHQMETVISSLHLSKEIFLWSSILKIIQWYILITILILRTVSHSVHHSMTLYQHLSCPKYFCRSWGYQTERELKRVHMVPLSLKNLH